MTIYHSLRDVTMPKERSCVAVGLFDGLHPGHRSVIEAAVSRAKQDGMIPCVFTFSLNHSHPASKESFGRLLSHRNRNRLLEQMGVSHMLCPPFEQFRKYTPEEFVRDMLCREFHAAHVFCGQNYRFGRHAAGDVTDLARIGAGLDMAVTTLPIVEIDGERVSSTRIRECIARGDMPGAHRLLQRPFLVDFVVIQGRRLGRTIDAPTINQALPSWFVQPKFGVYATVTTVDGHRYPSVTNVGMKPTVGSDYPLAETCILGYEGGDLYGREIPVEYFAHIRPERKFDSIEALRTQIHTDADAARKLCAGHLGAEEKPL